MESTGETRTFKSGAVRDGAAKKPMLQLISPHLLFRLGEWLRFACKDRLPEPYPPRNWEQGMPYSETLGSMERHIQAWKLGDTKEDHLAAIAFGAMALIHYEEEIEAGRLDPSIDDMPHYETPKPGDTRINPETGDKETYMHFGKSPEVLPEVQKLLTAVPENGGCFGPDCSCRFEEPSEYICRYGLAGSSLPRISDEDCDRRGDGCVGCPASDITGTIYIAGPMRGIDQFNFPAFDAARDRFLAWGYNVISPADMDRQAGFDPLSSLEPADSGALGEVILRDVQAITGSLRPFSDVHHDAIALLPGWEKSRGAAVEVALGKFLGLTFVNAETDVYMEV